jgi:hypothetical protein
MDTDIHNQVVSNIFSSFDEVVLNNFSSLDEVVSNTSFSFDEGDVNALFYMIYLINGIDNTIQESIDDYKNYEKKPIILELKTITYENTPKKYTTCSICISDFIEKNIVMELPCKHVFHEKCIKEWGMYKPECPNCKEKIPSKIEDVYSPVLECD